MSLQISASGAAAQQSLGLPSSALWGAVQRLANGLLPAEHVSSRTSTSPDQADVNDVAAVLQRMHTLAIQAASEALSPVDRASAQAEFERLMSELDRIRQAGGGQSVGENAQVAELEVELDRGAAFVLGDAGSAQVMAATLDGAVQRLAVTQNNLAAVFGWSSIDRADAAGEAARSAQEQILNQAAESVLAQANLSSAPLLRLLK